MNSGHSQYQRTAHRTCVPHTEPAYRTQNLRTAHNCSRRYAILQHLRIAKLTGASLYTPDGSPAAAPWVRSSPRTGVGEQLT
uniref:Uncharacterized protein n=1 Tax=Anguilla anguilla TaxID=7936 RepID=A0A0E9VCL9_ANGAN